MHEASIAQNIIETVQRQLTERKIKGRVESISIRLGRLTAVVPDNLSFLYGVLAEGTSLAGSCLEITMAPIKGTCNACGAGFEIEECCFLCSGCGSPDLQLLGGRELELEAVEVR